MNALLLILALAVGQDTPREEYARRAARLDGKDAEMHKELGDWCNDEKLWDLAVKEYEKALALQPNHDQARRRLGYRKTISGWERDKKAEKTWGYRVAVAKGVELPEKSVIDGFRKKGRHYREILGIYLDLDFWVASLRAVDELTGLFDGTLEIKVGFSKLMGDSPAMGFGKGGKGKIWFDIKKLAEYQLKIEKYERGKKSGQIPVIPPANRQGILTHELTHCFQSGSGTAWFGEGMATFCAQDGHYVAYFRHQKQKVESIEVKVKFKYNYPRGWAFFEYMKAKYGMEKLKEFFDLTIRKGKKIPDAAAKVSGKTWKELVAEEEKWSRDWMESYRVKD